MDKLEHLYKAGQIQMPAQNSFLIDTNKYYIYGESMVTASLY